MAGNYEALQILGSYGLEVEKAYGVLDFPDPNGGGYHVRTGHQGGLKTWRLVYEFMPDDPNAGCTVTLEDGSVQAYFEYYWRFFDRHHDPEVKPFKITCPETQTEYTVVFGEHTRSMRIFDFKLWSTGVLIKQWRTSGVTHIGEGGDGELSAPQAQEI